MYMYVHVASCSWNSVCLRKSYQAVLYAVTYMYLDRVVVVNHSQIIPCTMYVCVQLLETILRVYTTHTV